MCASQACGGVLNSAYASVAGVPRVLRSSAAVGGSAVLTLTNAAVLRAWKAEAPPPRLVGAGAAALFAAGALFLAETDVAMAEARAMVANAPPAVAAPAPKGYGGPVFTPPDVTKPSTARSAALAAHLKAKGANVRRVLGSHCFTQKQEFGKTAQGHRLLRVRRDGCASRRDACQARDIKGCPTWEIGGALYPGEKTLDELRGALGLLPELVRPRDARAEEGQAVARRPVGAAVAAALDAAPAPRRRAAARPEPRGAVPAGEEGAAHRVDVARQPALVLPETRAAVGRDDPDGDFKDLARQVRRLRPDLAAEARRGLPPGRAQGVRRRGEPRQQPEDDPRAGSFSTVEYVTNVHVAAGREGASRSSPPTTSTASSPRDARVA
ncbi:vitamin K epoxide reductase-like protein [Aureococcus anophagefferens]|nr:vitamin K epoxide reductase-like protein [Aureococcus anophagefferens]